jgi:hypothetical protein
MKSRTSVAALIALSLWGLLPAGCGPANEEALKGQSQVVPHKEGSPDFKTYSEAMQHQAQQSAKNVKSAGATPKAK